MIDVTRAADWNMPATGIERLVASCIALLVLAPALAMAQGDQIQVIPESIAQGGQLQVVVDGQPPGANRQILLRDATGGSQMLADIITDAMGQSLLITPLPAVAPGAYFVDLSSFAALIDSADLTVTGAPQISLDPLVAVAGQFIDISVTGLVPGTLKITFDGRTVVGPLGTDQTFQGAFQVPSGAAGLVDVTAENRLGTLLAGQVSTLFRRNAATQTEPSSLTVNRPVVPLRPGETYNLTGQIAVPDGTEPPDFEWTLVWETETGELFPVNVTPVQFDAAPSKAGNYGFAVMMVAPGMRAGYGPGSFAGGVDRLGFVYRNPDTGQSGHVRAPGVNGYDDYEGIVINGLVNDGNQQPLEGAIFTVNAKTVLFDPDEVDTTNRKALPPRVSAIAAVVRGNNQIIESLKNAQAAHVPQYTDVGCPVSLYNGQTGADGSYQIAFSPEYTEFLDNLINAPNVDINTPYKSVSIADEFRVRVSGLHLGYGVNKPGTQTYTGIVYEFRRDPQSGLYDFRESVDGPFNQSFDPNDTLVSELPQIPPGNDSVLPSDPYIPFLPAPVTQLKNNLEVPLISKLFTFPSRQGTALDNELTEIRLPWALPNFGPLDAILRLDGQVIGPLAVVDQESCDLESVDYSIEIAGLATRDAANGPIQGRIEGGTDTNMFFKDFEIELAPGPTWFEDTDAYESSFVSWQPHSVSMGAAEQPKLNDASVQNVPKDVGDLDNTNEENGTVFQNISNGLVGQQFRVASRSTTVAGNASSSNKKLFINGPTGFEYTSDLGFGRLLELAKNGRDDLYERVQNEEPDFGSAAFEVILDTGKIPIFRYMWGLEPIAGATLGADIWFKALLYYFGYLDLTDVAVDLDLIVEPQTQAGLDVFFDFSAILGLVSASMSANPAFGIAMPVVVINNAFDAASSSTCFQFVLDLMFEVEVGICPICLSASHSERALNEMDPDDCSILDPPGKSRKAVTPPSPDSLGIATNQVGTSFSVWADSDGIHAQKIVGTVPGTEYLVDSSLGAMRPDVSFFDINDAVAVWSQSSLTPAEFQARIDTDYDGANTVLFDGTVNQHMVYSVWDGVQWSPALTLTTPSTGEGGVKLATCMAGDSGCPAGGEVLAVWHRDMAGDIDQGNLKLYYAFFNGAAWTTPLPLDPLSTAKDLQPAPIYVNGQPVVIWVRNPSPDAQNPNTQSMGLGERQLVYRFINQPAGVQQPAGFPMAVASPTAAVFADGTISVAFTSSATGASFIGTRRSLWVATAENCLNGVCQWTAFQQTDQLDRIIYVEQPDIVMDNMDRATVLFRQLGVSGELQPTDPVGLQGFGDIGKIEFSLADLGGSLNNQPLTIDGAVNWQVAAVFDATLGSIVAVNTKGQAAQQKFAAQSSARRPRGLVTKGLSTSRGVVMYGMPHLPDLAIINALADTGVLQPGTTVTIEVVVANLGTPMAASNLVRLQMFWDGPPGVGVSAAETAKFLLTSPVSTKLVLDVTVPVAFLADDIHRLHLVVNPDSTIDESDSANNTSIITFGELPVPQNVVPSVDRVGTIVFLDWDAATDPRVSNYRVYRRHTTTMEEFAVGFTPVNGFADLNIVPGEEYQYRVSAVSARMMESQTSEWLTIAAVQARGDRIFLNGFELSR